MNDNWDWNLTLYINMVADVAIAAENVPHTVLKNAVELTVLLGLIYSWDRSSPSIGFL